MGTKRRGEYSAPELFAALIALFCLFPLRNNDLWWHLAAGRWMVANHAFPGNDPFSFTHFKAPWIDNEWLSEIVFYGVWIAGGNSALLVFRAFLFFALLMVLKTFFSQARTPSSFLPAAASGVALSYGWWELRPSVFSILGMIGLCCLLERMRRRKVSPYLIPLLFVFWCNLHPGFLLGILLLVGTVVLLWMEPLFGGTPWTGLPRLKLTLTWTAVLSIAATFFNPYGWRVYEQQVSIASNHAYRQILDEWAPPGVAFTLFAGSILLWFLLLRFRKTSLVSLAPLFLTAALSFSAVRFEEYFALIGIPVIFARSGWRSAPRIALFSFILIGAVLIGCFSPPGLSPPAQAVLKQADDQFLLHWSRGVCIAMVLLLAILYSGRLGRFSIPVRRYAIPLFFGMVITLALFAFHYTGIVPRDGVQENRYPVKCLEALPRSTEDHVFNRLSWGGWLLWEKGTLTYIDGRCWGEPIFFEYADVSRRWREIFQKWQIRWVIVEPTDSVAASLSSAPDWQVVCRDNASVVFTKRHTQ